MKLQIWNLIARKYKNMNIQQWNYKYENSLAENTKIWISIHEITNMKFHWQKIQKYEYIHQWNYRLFQDMHIIRLYYIYTLIDDTHIT